LCDSWRTVGRLRVQKKFFYYLEIVAFTIDWRYNAKVFAMIFKLSGELLAKIF